MAKITAEGKYNEQKIEQEYERLKTKLNKNELSFLVDKLVWDKCILIKTVQLISQDL